LKLIYKIKSHTIKRKDNIEKEERKKDSFVKMNPNTRDVLCGRGGGTRRHPGNKNYRSLIKSNKPAYLISTKEEKTSISRSIVAAIREQHGQFLEQRQPLRGGVGGIKNDQNKNKIMNWYDIGDAKATEKTSQALREGQPKLRQKMIEKGIIKDISCNSNRRPSIVEVIVGLPKPPLPEIMCYNNEKSVHGNSRSDLFDIDYMNIIGNGNNNNNIQNQLPSLGHHSLGNLLQEKNKLMCISNSSSGSNSNQYHKMHTTHHPYERLDQHQQHLAVSSPYEKQQPDNYCEDDIPMAHCTATTTHHHSNRMMMDFEDFSNHSIMTFDVDFDNDDDDLLDDVDDPLSLPPNHYLPVVSDDQGNCSDDDDDDDDTNTTKVLRFINNSCIYNPHIQREKKRMWEECKSSLIEKEQKWQEVQRNNNTDGYNQNNCHHYHHPHHHHDTNHHQHFDRHTEHEREHDNIQFTSNDFKYTLSSDYNNDHRDDNNNDDDDSGIISLLNF